MKRSFLLGVLLIALLIVPFANAVAENNVPRTINYTGNLYDYAGQPINKAVDLNVKIYNSQTGGTALWTEDHRNVQVEYGYFSVNLGTESPLNLDFKTQYWVELSVNGNSYARVPFTSSPYTFQSMRSFRADTADVAKEVLDGSITIASLADETRVVTGDVTGTYPELYIKDGVIVSKIGKGQITNYHISESVSLPPAGPAGGALTGQYPDPKLAENAVETFNIMDGAITYPKFQNAAGSAGTILVWNGTAWVESTVADWQIPEVDGVIGNEVIWATNGLEILTDEAGQLGVGIMYAGVTNDMLAGDITADKLAGDIPLDKFAAGNLPGQVMWWNNIAKEWVLTPNAPKENYVMKWIFNHEVGQAQLEWAEDNMSIPFYYEGASIDPNSEEPNLFSKTMFELVLDGARGASGNDIHGIAVTINDTKAGSALVLTGSGMNGDAFIPVAQITANPYPGSASYTKGMLNVSATIGSVSDNPSYGAMIDHTVTGSNQGNTTFGADIKNTVGFNDGGTVLGLDVMTMTYGGDGNGKIIGIDATAVGTGSEFAIGIAGNALNANHNVGVFGGVLAEEQVIWDLLHNNLSGYGNIGIIAYGPAQDGEYSNSLAFYAYGNSQFDGEITVRDNAYLNSDLYVQGNSYMQGNLTVEGYGDFNGTLNIDGMFSLDGVQGQTKELMIGQGNGVTPKWVSVANLMEDLVAGAGLVGANYDGSVTRTFAVDYDATLKMDVAGDAGKIGLDLAHTNYWTAKQNFVDLQTTGLLTASTVDINGGNIDGTVIGLYAPAAATFTTMTATTANITTDNVTDLALTGTLKLDGVQGAVKEVMIGQGAGNTPAWITVANLMEDLTDGEGIADFTYDGSTTVKIKTDIDGTTLKYDVAGDDGKVIVNQAWNFAWTGNNTWAGTSTFNNTLTATANVNLGDGNDNVVIAATNWTVNAAGNIHTNGTLDVNGATTLNSTLDVDGGTTLNSTLDVDLATTLNSTLDVDGFTTLNSTLDVDGATTLNSTLDVDLATTLNNTLDVDGATTLNSTLDVDGATTLNSTLDVDLATTLNNTLDVDGATTLNSTLDVDGATDLHSTLDVDGATYLFSTLEVDGATNLYSTLDVDGATYLYSTLEVDGATNLYSSLDVAGQVDLAAPGVMTTVRGTLNVDEDATFDANIYAPTGTIDDLTSNTIYVNTSLTLDDAAPLFASNGSGTPSEGNIGDLLVSRGAGFSPEWTTTIPLLNVTELSTDHLVVNDNTMPGMEPYFEVPFSGAREAVFGAPGLGQGVDVTIYGKLIVNNLEVVERIPYLEVYDLDVSHNITLGGKIIGGDADFENLTADDIDAKIVTTDRLHVSIDTYLTDVEAHGAAKFYDGLTVTGGDLIIADGFDVIAGHNLEVNNAINNPTTTLGVQEPVLVDDPEGLNVPNGPVQAQRLALTVEKVTAIGDLPNANAAIINYSDVVNIAQTDLPTSSLDGEVLYIVNTSGGNVTILGTIVGPNNMVQLVFVSGTWYVM